MIAAIVAVDKNYGIGNNGKLLVHIKEDMKMFKKITDEGSVIMGRKTFDSLPNKNKPLPNRTNIIITRKCKKKPKIQPDNTIHSNMEYIKAWLSQTEVIKENKGIYVIGGGQIYKELLNYCERVYITKVFKEYENVDTYFPNIDEMPEWELTSASEIKEEDGVKYQFCIYDRCDYKVLNVLTHNDRDDIDKNDMVVIVDTFNDLKTVIFRLDEEKHFTAYVDDWDYLKTEENLLKFVDKVKEFNLKKKEEVLNE